MINTKLVGAVTLLSCGLASSAQAARILYFVDRVQGTDQMAAALAQRPAGDTVKIIAPNTGDLSVVAEKAKEFRTELATGNYDLGILMVQLVDPVWVGAPEIAEAITALGRFAQRGGASIYANWDHELSGDLAALFGVGYSKVTGQTSITVGDDLDGGITSAINLDNQVGWSLYSLGLVAKTGSSIEATFENSDGAIVAGNGGRSITNGFLNDTFLDGLQGRQLYLNEIDSVLLAAAVPEPSSFALLGLALVGLVCGASRRRREQRVG